ncbi:MAG: arylsulfatase [Acidobacteriota bacterium]
MPIFLRREFLRAACSLPAILSARRRSTPGRRPNLVLILADDLGYGDVHCYDPAFCKIATPHIDQLASEGMLLTDAHAPSSVCSPTRYGLLTGRYAWRSRLQEAVLMHYAPPLIAKDRLTVAKLLKQQGYHTACIGKWHLGWNWPRREGKVIYDQPLADGPVTLGFDHYFGPDVPNFDPYCFIENDRIIGRPTAQKEKNDLNGRRGPMLPGWRFDRILPTITAKAVEYIDKRAEAGQPFFLYFALTAPHEPVAPSERFRGKSGINPVADFIMEADWSVGQIISALKRQGLDDDTLLIFVSDNGHAYYTGLEPLLKAGHRPSGPYRGMKGTIWEGGHRVPLIARWPGRIPSGKQCGHLVCLTDLLATCAELLGTTIPPNAGEDSVSFLPLLFAGNASRETLVSHSVSGQFAIRNGPWKLALCSGSGSRAGEPGDEKAVSQGLPPVQLYDLAQDPGEQRNLQGAHPDVVERLLGLLKKYVDEGRSTPGSVQANDVSVDIWKHASGGPDLT